MLNCASVHDGLALIEKLLLAVNLMETSYFGGSIAPPPTATVDAHRVKNYWFWDSDADSSSRRAPPTEFWEDSSCGHFAFNDRIFSGGDSEAPTSSFVDPNLDCRGAGRETRYVGEAPDPPARRHRQVDPSGRTPEENAY